MTIVPVILCGGSGTRLWPRSRKSLPKPFLPLVGDKTLFEATLARCGDSSRFGDPVVVTGAHHQLHVETQADANARNIVEPEGRNTAPTIALTTHRLPEDTVMLVCPSDHHIADTQAFAVAAQKAATLARNGWLVAFGIEAKSPETGFGYIKRGEALDETGFRVDRFVEKPDLETATAFLADGSYSWNGGLFAFTAGRFLEELAAYQPELADTVANAFEGGRAEGRCSIRTPKPSGRSQAKVSTMR